MFNDRYSGLEYRYGITEEIYYELLKKQKGVCKICGNPPTKKDHKKNKDNRYYLHVDHCHTTGAVRGLLCRKCNTGLGMFRDRQDLLDTAKAYLTNTSEFLIPNKFIGIK